jgi:hypothetical protein
MYNLVRAAEAGWQGRIVDALDFELPPPGPQCESPPHEDQEAKPEQVSKYR